MGALRVGKVAALASALVLHGCASPEAAESALPEPQVAGDPGPTPPAFRIEVTGVHYFGGGRFTLEVRLIPEGADPAGEGTLYVERFGYPEAPLRAIARDKPPQIAERMKAAFGGHPGFSLTTQIDLVEVPMDGTTLPDLVVEAPVDRILTFDEHRLELQEGKGREIYIDPIVFQFACQKTFLWMSYGLPFELSPATETKPWLATSSRSPMDLLTITDAAGIPLHSRGGGKASGVIDHEWVSPEGGRDTPIRYPVTAAFRVPTRWERTVQRFVLKDIHIPGR